MVMSTVSDECKKGESKEIFIRWLGKAPEKKSVAVLKSEE